MAAVTLLVVALASGTTRPTAAYVLAPPSSSPCTRGTFLLSLDCPVTDSASALLFTPLPCHLVTTRPLTPPRHPLFFSPSCYSAFHCQHLFTCCSVLFFLLFCEVVLLALHQVTLALTVASLLACKHFGLFLPQLIVFLLLVISHYSSIGCLQDQKCSHFFVCRLAPAIHRVFISR